jgi:hypothetical protein
MTWDLNNPPNWPKRNGKATPVLTKKGYEDPDTGEVLVAMGNRLADAGISDVVDVKFLATEYSQGDILEIEVTWNEAVDVLVGCTIEVAWSGVSGNFFATLAGSVTNQHRVVFTTTIPLEPGVLALMTGPVISGTVKDTGTLVNSNVVVPANLISPQITVA